MAMIQLSVAPVSLSTIIISMAIWIPASIGLWWIPASIAIWIPASMAECIAMVMPIAMTTKAIISKITSFSGTRFQLIGDIVFSEFLGSD
jgi:NADH:ubiquinone oxidoreductase subunit 6 (subunit J)